MNLSIPCKSALGLLTLLELGRFSNSQIIELASHHTLLSEINHASSVKGTKGKRSFPLLSTTQEKGQTETLFSLPDEPLSPDDDDAWFIAHETALNSLEETKQRGIGIVHYFDQNYPPLLKLTENCPPILYTRGRLPEGVNNIACVGTRNPTNFGKETTSKTVETLVQEGWVIVSGLAVGIDTAAHKAALDAGGITVAVLGNGLDTVYPRRNMKLAEQIVESGGALISEYPIGEQPIPQNLVARDRIQSGMSIGTIVVQTDMPGGSFHTVRFSLLQNRPVFVPVPERDVEENPASRGIYALMQMPGRELASVLKAKGQYEKLLNNFFANRPVASSFSADALNEFIVRLNERCDLRHCVTRAD